MNVFFQEHSLTSYTADLTKALSDLGVKINLFTMRPQLKRLSYYGVKVRYFPFSKAIWIMPTSRAKKIVEGRIGYHWLLKKIKDANLEVFHINTASKSEMFLRAKKEYRIPIVYTNHYVPEPEPLETLDSKEFLVYKDERLWIRHICDHSFKVVTVSKYAKRRLKEEFDIDSIVIYHGVDLIKYNPFLPISRENLGFKSDEKIVLWVARLGHHPYKDPFTFIKAISIVVRQHPKTSVVMVGKGFLKPYIINLARKLSVAKIVGFLDHVRNLNYFYAASDVFVLPSYNDNFGLVAAEAMACGKPVVISDRGAPKEVVGDAGLTFEYGSHRDLAEKISILLEDEDKCRKIGARAHKRIIENFTWDKAAKKYIDIYEEVS